MTAARIKNRRARITLCAGRDIAETGGVMRLARQGIYSCWAEIKAKAPQSFGSSGYSPEQITTHIITIAYRPNVEISNAAWVYRARQKSPPQWFKVVKLTENEQGRLFVLRCRLVERGDDALKPVADAPGFRPTPLPEGVDL